jgi:MafB19-like deaminase
MPKSKPQPKAKKTTTPKLKLQGISKKTKSAVPPRKLTFTASVCPFPGGKDFTDVAAERKRLGLPLAGSDGDSSTVSKLTIDGKSYYGVNSSKQNPKTPITLTANAQTKTHAEAEVVQKAINDGKKGKAKVVEMWVDRDACSACGVNNGIGSLVRELGAEKIIVHSPSGTVEFKPPTSKPRVRKPKSLSTVIIKKKAK